jgi:hypothetical protein
MMSAVIQQWIDGLISSADEEPPDLTLDDPGSFTSVDEEKAQELVDAINAARTVECSRNGALDTAAMDALGAMYNAGRTGLRGDTPELFCTRNDYGYDGTVGVTLGHVIGARTATDAAASMAAREPGLLADDRDEIGAAYLYFPQSYGYYWAAIVASPGSDGQSAVVTDPASDAADEAEDGLSGVEIPEPDEMTPKKLSEASAQFARVAAAYRAAVETVERLQVEQSERMKRIATLEKIKTDAAVPVHAWAAEYVDDLAIGAQIATAEPPGWYRSAPVARSTTIDGVSYGYEERGINLTPRGSGQLRRCEGLSDEMIFVNLALEPGHLKWAPHWRYGTVTAISLAFTYSIDLDAVDARTATGLGTGLDLLQSTSLSDVQAVCACADKIVVGDEVLIEFTGESWDSPVIIGWRREPKSCADTGRISWGEIF